MPIAVLDLKFEDLPDTIAGLEGYRGAFILMRLRGRPAGQALLPVENGRICGGKTLRDEFLKAANWSFLRIGYPITSVAPEIMNRKARFPPPRLLYVLAIEPKTCVAVWML